MESIFVRQHYGDGRLRIVDVERAALGNQLHQLRALVIGLAHVECNRDAVGSGPRTEDGEAEHPNDIPYAEFGIRDIIPSG